MKEVILMAVILVFSIVCALLDPIEVKRLKETKITEAIRVRFYRETIICGWFPVIIILLFVIADGLTFTDIGLRRLNFSEITWLNVITLIVIGAYTLLILYQTVMCFFCEPYRVQVEQIFEKKSQMGRHYDRVIGDIMLPRTRKEKILMFFVSLTAGLCEELIWRGTMMYLLETLFPDMNLILVVVIVNALFGFLHLYQGPVGVGKTAVVGTSFSLLYLVSGSLIPGMLLHTLFDASSIFIAKPKPEENEGTLA